MRVLLTGGTGHIGKATTERLVHNGWDVRVIDLNREAEVPGADYVTCDILDYDDLRRQMRGCDAVIHLAAIRGPSLAPGHRLFEVNVAGTFNVFEAAAAEGIRRVVQASSINALGAAWGVTDMAIKYLPVDEEHPSFTTDPYSFSKEMIEDIGRYYWRRDGISSVALRFPGVYANDFIKTDDYRLRRETSQKVMDELARLSETERQARLADVKQRTLEYRKRRPFEYKDGVAKWPQRNNTDDLLWYIDAFDRYNLWAFLDVRDAAQSLEKGVTADYEGSHALFVNDDHNSIGYESAVLARYFFPEVSQSNVALTDTLSLVSIEKARALIGFEPEYSVANWDNLATENQP